MGKITIVLVFMLYLVGCDQPLPTTEKIIYFKDPEIDVCFAARIAGMVVDYESMTCKPTEKVTRKVQIMTNEDDDNVKVSRIDYYSELAKFAGFNQILPKSEARTA